MGHPAWSRARGDGGSPPGTAPAPAGLLIAGLTFDTGALIALRGVRVEDVTTRLARLAGEALAAVPRATPVDAIVMASAASRGDVVYTSDFDELVRLTSFFPDVRVLAV